MSRYRSGPFEIDAHRLEIRREGARIACPPRVLQLVLFLVEHRARAVSKDELQARLWPGIAVSEASLATAVKEARRLLGDDGSSQRFILTVRGRGYTWNEPTEELALPAAGPTDVPSFVGRQRELAALSRLVDETAAGRGRFALITGDAGIGKTRLAAELGPRALSVGLSVASTRCDGLDGAPAFQPWRQLLAIVTKQHPELTPPALLQARAGHTPATRDAALPDARRFQLFEDTLGFVTRASEAGGGWMLCFDDLQAADPDTLALVAALARSLDRHRVLVVATWREPELLQHDPREGVRRLLLHEPAVAAFHLQGLELADTMKLVERLAPEAPPEFSTALHHEAQGNPFFVEEVIRGIAARGPRGSFRAEQAHRVRPEGLQEVLRARLAQRGARCLALLEAACVLGHEFSPRIAELVAEVPAEGGLDAWDEAEAASLVRSVPGDRPRLAFTHALLRETVALRVGGARRAMLHLRAAEILESRGSLSDPELIVQLAHHYRSAGPLGVGAKGAHFARLAAVHASERLAFGEATRYLRDALELGAGEPSAVARGQLFVELGRAQFNAGDIAASRQSYLEAARLLRGANEPAARELFCRATLGLGRGLEAVIQPVEDGVLTAHLREALEKATTIGQRSLLMSRLAIASQGITLNPEGSQIAAEALALSSQLDDLDAQVYAQLARFWAVKHPSRGRETLACSDELARLAQRSTNGYWAAWAMLLHATSLVDHGRIEDARQLAARQAAHIRCAQHPAARAAGHDLSSLIAMIAWHPEEAESALAAGHALNRNLGDLLLADMATLVGRFAVLSQLGRAAELVPVLRAALAAFPFPPVRALLAAATWRSGGITEARPQYEIVRDELATLEVHRYFTMTVVISDLVVAFDDEEGAARLESLLRRAEAPHVTVGASYFGPMARHLALCADAQRRRTDAESLLARAADQAHAIGARWWCEQIVRDRVTLRGLASK